MVSTHIITLLLAGSLAAASPIARRQNPSGVPTGNGTWTIVDQSTNAALGCAKSDFTFTTDTTQCGTFNPVSTGTLVVNGCNEYGTCGSNPYNAPVYTMSTSNGKCVSNGPYFGIGDPSQGLSIYTLYCSSTMQTTAVDQIDFMFDTATSRMLIFEQEFGENLGIWDNFGILESYLTSDNQDQQLILRSAFSSDIDSRPTRNVYIVWSPSS